MNPNSNEILHKIQEEKIFCSFTKAVHHRICHFRILNRNKFVIYDVHLFGRGKKIRLNSIQRENRDSVWYVCRDVNLSTSSQKQERVENFTSNC